MIPIDITLLGIEIDSNWEHDANAEFPIKMKWNYVITNKNNIFYSTRYSYRCKSIDMMFLWLIVSEYLPMYVTLVGILIDDKAEAENANSSYKRGYY